MTRRGSRPQGLPPLLRFIIVPLAALAAAVGGYAMVYEPDRARPERVRAVAACDIERAYLQRLWRGYTPYRSGDVLLIERYPNGFGKRHASPFPYTQDVPLVLYGPGFIQPGRYEGEVTHADLAPTFAELLGFDDFPRRDGRVLKEALLPPEQRNTPPRLIVTVVWDGAGDNALARWPEAWPNLEALLPQAADFVDATVGSSPTITPTAHATMGTGSWAKTHGLPDGLMRVKGRIVDPWEKASPRHLRVKTLADLYDAAMDNRPLIGVLARDSWHLGMIGHGAYLPEGDRDIAVLDTHGKGTAHRTNPDYYRMPAYFRQRTGLAAAVRAVDGRDGALDGRWLGNPYMSADNAKVRYTPAWPIYQTGRLIELIDKEGFGADEVPDLLFTNFKSIDLASHEWTMNDPEFRDNLAETDRELPRLLRALDRLVGRGRYVLALTSDHGVAAPPQTRGGWPIFVPEMTRDIHARFDHTNPDVPLVQGNRGWTVTLTKTELEANGVSAQDVARFLRAYTIEDNLSPGQEMPPAWQGRGREKVFLTALTPDELRSALRCSRARREAEPDADGSLSEPPGASRSRL